jgi:predicted DNA-binding ribbon-helix-helix protein
MCDIVAGAVPGPSPVDPRRATTITENCLQVVYSRGMGQMIRVAGTVHDRLVTLARERGCTIGELVAELADTRLTRQELEARGAAARAYIRGNLAPDMTDEDFDDGQRLLDDIAAGRTTVLG